MLIFPFGTDREATNTGWITLLLVGVWIGLFVTYKSLERSIDSYIPQSIKSVTNQLGENRKPTNKEEMVYNDDSSIKTPIIAEDLGFSSPQTREADDLFSKYELDPSKGWIPGALTHELIHRHWLPIVSNIIFILAFGIAMERWFGALIYTILVLSGTLIAAASQIILLNHFLGSWPGQAINGGSGLLVCIVGAFLRTQNRSQIKIIGAYWVTTRNYLLPAWIFLLAWVSYQTAEIAINWTSTSPILISAYILTLGYGIAFSSIIPSPYREEIVSDHRGAKTHTAPEIRIANTPIEQQGNNNNVSGIRRGLAAPPPPTGLHTAPPLSLQSSGYHNTVKPAIELAWRALEADSISDARNEFSRQFSQWIKDGLSGFESLIRNLDMLRSRYPNFNLHTAMAYELGVYMRKNNEWGLCHYCLQQTLHSDPPLSEALCDKRDSMMLEMEEQMRQARERNELIRKNRQAMSKSTRDEFEVTGDMLSVFVPEEVAPTSKPAKELPKNPLNAAPTLEQAWAAVQENRPSDARRLFRMIFPVLMKEVRTGFPKILRTLERLKNEYPDFRLSLQNALELGIYLTQRNEWELALYCLNQTIAVEHRLSDSLRAKRDQAMAHLQKKVTPKSKKSH